MIADYNGADFALAADKQTYLPVDVAGKKGYLPCKIISNDIFRRYASVTKMLKLFDLRGAQPRSISRNFVDSRFPFLKYSPHNIHLRPFGTPPPAKDTLKCLNA